MVCVPHPFLARYVFILWLRWLLSSIMVHGVSGDFLSSRGFAVSIDAGGSGRALDCVVSHAHSDHAVVPKNSASRYWMTPETRQLIAAKLGKKNVVQTTRFGQKHLLGDATLSLHSAGHILGSAQVLLENSQRLLVSGDFKLEGSILFPGADTMLCDSLVLESTFGLPHFVFPPREQIYHEMGSWAKKEVRENHAVVLSGYATGKAQELTKICNEFVGEIPLVHEKVFEVNRVYEQCGVKLGAFEKMDHNLKDFNVFILPPSLVSSHLLQALSFSLQKPVRAAIATGWNFSAPYYDRLFSLSDHADFNQLMQYVRQTEPKIVYTNHGFSEELAGFIQRRLKIPARSLENEGQKAIAEFC